MNSRTLISARAAIAIHFHSGRIHSFHLDGPQGVECHQEEVRRLFGDSRDVIAVPNLSPEDIPARLELEWRKGHALVLCLLLLDRESNAEARRLAVPDIEESLAELEILKFLQFRLYVAPLPDNADLIGSINRAYDHRASKLVALLEDVGEHQTEISRCRAAWDAVTFPDETEKEGLAFELVNSGAFHALAAARPGQRGAALIPFLTRPEMRGFNGWQSGLTAWANACSDRKHEVNRGAEEEEDQEYGRHGRSRRSTSARVLDDVLQVIDRQKEEIRQALTEGSTDRAREFAADLVDYQRRNSKPIHIAKSLCDLAQSAKQLGHHDLQLEWARQAVDLVPDDGWSLVQLGDALLLNGDWKGALYNFDLGRVHGEAEVAQNGRAEVLKSLGQLDEALQEYTTTVGNFPQNVVARTGRAEVLKSLGQLEEALQEYTATVRDFPQEMVAQSGRAEALKSLGRLEEALQAYSSILRDFPQNVVARNGRAGVLKSLGRLEESLQEYTATVRDFPRDRFARTGRAEVLKSLGQLEESLQEYTATVRDFPRNAAARSGRAEVLKSLGQLEESLQEYTAIVRDFPRDVVARTGRAEVLKSLGQLEESLQEYTATVRDFPRNVVARTGRAEILKSLGQLEESFQEYTAIVRDFPKNVVARSGRAGVLKSLGQLEESLQECTAIVRDFPQDVVARSGRAEILKSLGQMEESLQEYTATVRDFPQNLIARTGRAEVLKSLGRLEESLQEYAIAIRDFPQSVVARTGAAGVCIVQGNWDTALRWLGAPTETQPVNWVGMHVQAMIYLQMGRTEEAMRLLERGTTQSPWEQRRYFKSGLGYARLLARQPRQAAQVLAEETTPVARILQMHIYTELNETAKAKGAYDAATRLTREPRVVELTAELAARAKLLNRKPAHSDQWVFNRELELLLAA